ncbi:hypothetical protein DEVEQU_00466 [Devosia equisanguinis]|uniref:Uncharacterized protein n=2 Tax=Devosia equisanguinis TaxID=2490941 RepID=A0A3S5D368_9HYPH|nr:hypothetical protein DEVEQU_00466 [Devosia equisanguinis]
MLRDVDEFRIKHLEILTRRNLYRERKHRLNRSIPPYNRDTAIELRADDIHARIAFAEIALRNVVEWVEASDSKAGHKFVTVAIGRHVVDPAHSASFDPRHLQLFIQKALKGFDFVGYVEFSYYPRWPHGVPSVHPHAHLIVRGPSEKKLRASLSVISQRHMSLIPGWDSAFASSLASPNVGSQLLYALKFPLHSYAPYPKKATTWDPETGEELKLPTGKFAQHKNDLRTGELDLMAGILSNQFLDRMMFAGGTGIAVKDAIIGEALRPFRSRRPQA